MLSDIEKRLQDYAYESDGDDMQFRAAAYTGGDYDYIIQNDIHVDDIDLSNYDTRVYSEKSSEDFILGVRSLNFSIPEAIIKYNDHLRSSVVAKSDGPGLIWINSNTDLFNKEVLDHEIGHQLTDISGDLQRLVIENPGNIFGYFDKKYQKFVGILGEYNPEEAFATSCSYYINHNSFLKKN